MINDTNQAGFLENDVPIAILLLELVLHVKKVQRNHLYQDIKNRIGSVRQNVFLLLNISSKLQAEALLFKRRFFRNKI